MKGLLLISSGIDSPVAGWLMMRNKVDLAGIHFSNYPYADEKVREMVLRLAKKIGIKKLYIVKHGDNQKDIMKCNPEYQCVLCKRIMYRVAEKIAERDGYDVLVTGDNLGQVASQTLDNMAVTSSAVKIKILRPLLCNDKVETINIAKKIGTFDISTEKAVCCKVVPRHPITKAQLEKVEAEEKKLDIRAIVKKSVDNAEIINL